MNVLVIFLAILWFFLFFRSKPGQPSRQMEDTSAHRPTVPESSLEKVIGVYFKEIQEREKSYAYSVSYGPEFNIHLDSPTAEIKREHLRNLTELGIGREDLKRARKVLLAMVRRILNQPNIMLTESECLMFCRRHYRILGEIEVLEKFRIEYPGHTSTRKYLPEKKSELDELHRHFTTREGIDG
jgi:hypothetical protein